MLIVNETTVRRVSLGYLRRRCRRTLCVFVDQAEATSDLITSRRPPLSPADRVKLLAYRKDERTAQAEYMRARLRLIRALAPDLKFR